MSMELRWTTSFVSLCQDPGTLAALPTSKSRSLHQLALLFTLTFNSLRKANSRVHILTPTSMSPY